MKKLLFGRSKAFEPFLGLCPDAILLLALTLFLSLALFLFST